MAERISSIRSDGDGPTTEALAEGSARPVGTFRHYFEDQRWEWSAEIAGMHGYALAAMTPTIEQVAGHQHPGDSHQIAVMLKHVRHNRAAFCLRHRIIDTRGRVHHLVIASHQLRDECDAVIGAQGFYIDLSTDSADEQRQFSKTVAEIADRRAVIEQVKGVLMAVCDVDAESAFALLRWRSQVTNIKLRRLAEQLMADFRAARLQGVPSRVSVEDLVLTVHERVDDGGHD